MCSNNIDVVILEWGSLDRFDETEAIPRHILYTLIPLGQKVWKILPVFIWHWAVEPFKNISFIGYIARKIWNNNTTKAKSRVEYMLLKLVYLNTYIELGSDCILELVVSGLLSGAVDVSFSGLWTATVDLSFSGLFAAVQSFVCELVGTGGGLFPNT